MKKGTAHHRFSSSNGLPPDHLGFLKTVADALGEAGARLDYDALAERHGIKRAGIARRLSALREAGLLRATAGRRCCAVTAAGRAALAAGHAPVLLGGPAGARSGEGDLAVPLSPPFSKRALSARDCEAMRVIAGYLVEHGRGPSHGELAARLGLHRTAAQRVFERLRAKGVLGQSIVEATPQESFAAPVPDDRRMAGRA